MYFGTSYYPEHTEKEQIEKDIELMKNAGLNVIRTGEFAWSKIQPQEGVWDFSWLDEVIEKMAQSGIETIIGTPTAVPPKWLIDKHPEVCQTMADGRNRGYGARRNACVNNPEYLKYSAEITKKIAEHYKDNKNVIAYQIDNELMAEEPYCYCGVCRKKFRDKMKEKYGSIEALNKKWGLGFWSLDFPTWESVEIPKKDRQPSALKNYYEFTSDCYVDFAHNMADIIRAVDSTKIITHNICSGGFLFKMDLKKLFDKLDVTSFDSYPLTWSLAREYGKKDKEPFEPSEARFASALTRSYKHEHFWITEEQTPSLRDKKKFELLSMLETAEGARMHCVFEWRKLPFGAEQGHPSILSYDSVPRTAYDILKNTVGKLKALEIADEAMPKADVAIIRDFRCDLAYMAYNHSPKSFDYLLLIYEFYRAVVNSGVNCDIIMPEDDFSKYKLVIAPAQKVIDRKRADKITEYVKLGGNYISTIFSALTNDDNVMHMKTAPCFLDELFGIEVEDTVYNVSEPIKAQSCRISVGYDFVNTKGASIRERIFDDLPLLTENQCGKGAAYYFAALLDKAALKKMLGEIMESSGVYSEFEFDNDKIQIVKNVSGDDTWYYIVNFDKAEQRIRIGCRYENIETKKVIADEICIGGESAIVLKKLVWE